MAEYIEREAAFSKIGPDEYYHTNEIKDILRDIPAADVVEVVRCEQCRSLYKSIDPFNGHVSYRCSSPYGLQGHVLPHFYCVHGFKGEEGQTDDRE